MPNIAQQDYIVIDWEGKTRRDAAKKAEVDAQLKNIYLANPLALLSVLFKHYSDDVIENTYYPIIGVVGEIGDNTISILFYDAYNGEITVYDFSIE